MVTDDLVVTISNSFLRPGRRFGANEARDAVGLTQDEFTDVAGFKSFTLARDLFTEEALLEFSRTLSTALAALELQFEPAGRRQLKGFDQPVPLMTLVQN